MGNNPQKYVQERNETCIFEQKPVDKEDFREKEEKIVRERVEKCKIKRRAVAEKNKLLKKKKKVEQDKKSEQVLK